MEKQNHFDAAVQALLNHDTEAIKGILKQDSYADCIFPLVTDTRVQLYPPDLLLRVNATLPVSESLRSHFWKFNYEDRLENILLHLAAKISDFELARLLLEKGAELTSVDPSRGTALHKAFKKKSLEMIKFLTEKSPAYILDLGDICGITPLDNACKYSTPEVVQLLLSQGSSVTAKTSRDGPLLNAVFNVEEYATPIASLLSDAGANINHVSPALGTPLIAAVKESLFKTLVKNSAWIKGTAANSTACQTYSFIDLLIDRGCDVNAVNSEGQTALHVAVKTKQEIFV
ncbi:putative ankyrin repeat protein RF_0381 [Stegodyphus dumicola]|uniref:putative ankyrin repeat protein RF_0381 n=1 Tax=Stegodyphus dumicola TaxID=202533 RepID=UPI0015B0B169|nr:putative ankyrin repeat protein RF_0381 [Stegodyphus dumicola]XP_035232736.1 putative ankyrin repeat protein RF_0381 [Stegodyphus dumicola]